MEFLLELLRLFHKAIGITPAAPEHERAFLLVWIATAIAIILLGIGLVLFLVPRIMH